MQGRELPPRSPALQEVPFPLQAVCAVHVFELPLPASERFRTMQSRQNERAGVWASPGHLREDLARNPALTAALAIDLPLVRTLHHERYHREMSRGLPAELKGRITPDVRR